MRRNHGTANNRSSHINMDELNNRLSYHWDNLTNSALVRDRDVSERGIREFQDLLNRSIPVTDSERTVQSVIRYLTYGSSEVFANAFSDSRKQQFTLFTDGITISHVLRIDNLVTIRWERETQQYSVYILHESAPHRESAPQQDAEVELNFRPDRPRTPLHARRGGSSPVNRFRETRPSKYDKNANRKSAKKNQKPTRDVTVIPPLGKSAALDILNLANSTTVDAE